MLAGEMLWVVGTDEQENTTCEQLNIWTHSSEIPQSGGTEIRTENQSILNGSLTTGTMLKSPAICYAVKGEMMVYINPYLQLLIFRAYVVNETYKNMQNVMAKRMRCSVVCHILHRIRHRIRHGI